MSWAIFLVLHLVGLVGYTIQLKKSPLAKADKYLVSALMTSFMFLPSVVFAISGKVHMDVAQQNFGWIVLQALLYVGVNLLTVQALNHLDASVFTIIYSTRLLFVTVLAAVILREVPPAMQIVGGCVILASIFLLNLHKNRQYLSRPVLYGFAATLWFSLNAVAEKHLVSHIGVYQTVFFATGLTVFLQWLLVIMRRTKLAEYKNKIFHKETAMLMIYRPLSMWFYIFAVSSGAVAVVNYVSGMGVVLIVGIGIVILKEREHIAQKLAATALAFVGFTIILISKLGIFSL